MSNKLKKIKGLTANRELSDRIGVAMFVYARSMDLEGPNTPEKDLARWALANPMVADQTMLALVATDPEIIEASTEIAQDSTSVGKAANSNAPQPTQGYTPINVSVEEVSDDSIISAVEANWGRVSQRYVQSVPVAEQVTVTQGEGGLNPFLSTAPIIQGPGRAKVSPTHNANEIQKPKN